MRISDWSSDVCSSDLVGLELPVDDVDGFRDGERGARQKLIIDLIGRPPAIFQGSDGQHDGAAERQRAEKQQQLAAQRQALAERADPGCGPRSAERRGGKEGVSTCRSRWWRDQSHKK